MENFDIETPRLRLICCDKKILDALFNGDKALADLLNIKVPPRWTLYGEPAFKFTYEKIIANIDNIEWWSYLPVFKKANTLVGSCGFKGEPADEMVEIGYEVAEAYRGWGLATEMAKALVKKAFESPGVEIVRAHTLAEINESGSILKKCGMRKIGDIVDPTDGKLWRWEIRKQPNN